MIWKLVDRINYSQSLRLHWNGIHICAKTTFEAKYYQLYEENMFEIFEICWIFLTLFVLYSHLNASKIACISIKPFSFHIHSDIPHFISAIDLYLDIEFDWFVYYHQQTILFFFINSFKYFCLTNFTLDNALSWLNINREKKIVNTVRSAR